MVVPLEPEKDPIANRLRNQRAASTHRCESRLRAPCRLTRGMLLLSALISPLGSAAAEFAYVANENSNRDNFSVDGIVHPHFHKLGKHFSSVLGIKLIGVDVMATDISVSLDESGGVINELNIPPGLHYHELIANRGAQTNVATQILDNVFSGSDLQISMPVAVQQKADHLG